MNKKTKVWVGHSNQAIKIVDRKVVHCETFGDFAVYLMNIKSSDQLPNSVSLSKSDVFDNGGLTPVEYINCYTNFIKLTNQRFSTSHPINISVRIGTDLASRKQVELLQTTGIIGIGPMQVVYGPEAVLETFNDRDKYGAAWPSYLISNNDSLDLDVITLTPRQQVIFDLIRNRGASNKQIAKYLNLSESAVKFHVGHILKKYCLKNRTQLAVLHRSA